MSTESYANLISETNNEIESQNKGFAIQNKSDTVDNSFYKKIDDEKSVNSYIDIQVSDEQLISKTQPKKCLFVELNEDVSYFNMSTFYLVQFSYVSTFTFIDACQDHLWFLP